METLAFFVFATAWLALPLAPALLELYRPRDDKPLAVAAHNEADPLAPFEEAERMLRENPAAARREVLRATGVLCAGAQEPWQSLASSARALWLDGTLTADQNIPPGLEAFRATSAVVMPQARLQAPLAVDATARLLPGCQVRVVQARVVRAGAREQDTRPDCARLSPHPSTLVKSRNVQGATWHPVQGWWYAPKGASVPANVLLDGDVVSAADLVVGSSTVVRGSLKAAGRVLVREGSRIEGDVVARSVELAAGVFVSGSVVADEKVVMGASCWVGDEGSPSSVLARDIVMYEGAGVCGAVVAHRAVCVA